jgi:hypothetical protein
MQDVSTELLYASYMEFASSARVQHPISRETLGRFLKKMGCEPRRLAKDAVGEHIVDEPNLYGSSHRIAKVIYGDRPHGYSIGELEIAREAFDRAIGAKTDWGDAEADD